MIPYVILIAGIPASGKTTYARHITEKLNIPFIGKDSIKEKLYDVLHYDKSTRENLQLYGAASYSVFFHIAECLMKANVPLVMESNFNLLSVDYLLPIINKYKYRAMTVLFDADLAVLHERYYKRDVTDERHPGLANSFFYDFDTFSKNALSCRKFCIGNKITVETTDFKMVDYSKVDALIMDFIHSEYMVD